MQPRPKSSGDIRKLSFCTGQTSMRSQLFPGVLISCVSKLLCLIKDVTMTFPHIHKLRLCINILLFALTCEWFSSKLKMKSTAWAGHHSFQLIRDLFIPSACNAFTSFQEKKKKTTTVSLWKPNQFLTSMRKSPVLKPAFHATPPSSTDSRYCKAGNAGVGVNSSMGVSAKSPSQARRDRTKGKKLRWSKDIVLVYWAQIKPNLGLQYI